MLSSERSIKKELFLALRRYLPSWINFDEPQKFNEKQLWDTTDSHHILPVFAAGISFVPTSFDTLLVQSFYSQITPLICDKLVCGQKGQSVMHAIIPSYFIGRSFLDLFRSLLCFQVHEFYFCC
jgi:hypothetical protein